MKIYNYCFLAATISPFVSAKIRGSILRGTDNSVRFYRNLGIGGVEEDDKIVEEGNVVDLPSIDDNIDGEDDLVLVIDDTFDADNDGGDRVLDDDENDDELVIPIEDSVTVDDATDVITEGADQTEDADDVKAECEEYEFEYKSLKSKKEKSSKSSKKSKEGKSKKM